MCDEQEIETTDEIPVLFTADIELLGARLTDIITAMGLPEDRTNAVIRLIYDAVEDHHEGILDTFDNVSEIEQEEEN
ncbi:MAG: hypothetical protein K0R78_3279 [Pelosinus sp.]|nr:hypothetical protein [Pelosinus sp.]